MSCLSAKSSRFLLGIGSFFRLVRNAVSLRAPGRCQAAVPVTPYNLQPLRGRRRRNSLSPPFLLSPPRPLFHTPAGILEPAAAINPAKKSPRRRSEFLQR